MVGTAADYLRFSQMMLNGGTFDDVRILGAGTVAHMSSDHLGPISRDGEIARRLLGPATGFGLGFAPDEQTILNDGKIRARL
jgi:CubicO group peptidase (beta-lactamase class C family)